MTTDLCSLRVKAAVSKPRYLAISLMTTKNLVFSKKNKNKDYEIYKHSNIIIRHSIGFLLF